MSETTLTTLRAVFVADDSKKRRDLTGARCELPNGQVVETRGRRTPLYDLARKLDELGFGDWKLQAYTPTGTPSLRGKVSVMADIAIVETDRDGLQRRKFRPFVPIGAVQDAQVDSEGAQPPEKPETPLCVSPDTEEAA